MVIEKWCNRMMVTLTNRSLTRAGSTLREPLVIWRFLRHFTMPNIGKGQKTVLPFELGALSTLPYDKSGPGFCITFIKKLDEGMR